MKPPFLQVDLPANHAPVSSTNSTSTLARVLRPAVDLALSTSVFQLSQRTVPVADPRPLCTLEVPHSLALSIASVLEAALPASAHPRGSSTRQPRPRSSHSPACTAPVRSVWRPYDALPAPRSRIVESRRRARRCHGEEEEAARSRRGPRRASCQEATRREPRSFVDNAACPARR